MSKPRKAPQASHNKTRAARTRPMTAQEREFVRHYLETGNAHQAFRRAGFTRAGSRNGGACTPATLVARPAVARAIEKGRQAMEQALGLSAAEVHREIRTIITSDIEDFDVNEETGAVTSRCGDPNATRAISSKRVRKRTRQTGIDQSGNPITETTTEVDIKLWPKTEGLNTAARILGMGDRPPAAGPTKVIVGLDLDALLGRKKAEPK
jgi:hypothetical protein